MPVLPNSLSLVVIADGSPIVAADHRNNYAGIQGATNGLIAILDNGNAIDGDPLVWDATLQKWSAASRLAAGRPRAPRVVTSLLSGGPPASPLDGDIWIATGVDAANGVRWHFQYNAGSASAFKWEFIGGAPVARQVSTAESTAASAPADLATVGPSYTIVRPGDYQFHAGATISGAGTSGGNASVNLAKNGGVSGNTGVVSISTTAGAQWNVHFVNSPPANGTFANLAANDVIKLMYAISNALGTNFSLRYLLTFPIRVS